MTSDEQLDHSAMGRGKYHDKTASHVAETDPRYLVWAYEAWTPKPCSRLLYDDCVAEIQSERVGRDQARD